MVCYLGLGSNLGNRLDALSAAIRALARTVEVQKSSSVYETVPETNADEPLYLNAVLRIATGLLPWDLLGLCLATELTQGRIRRLGEPKGPRVIDIDLLLHGDQVIDEPMLRVPHPRLLGRPFVRIPLAEVACPGLRHPITGDLLDVALPEEGVRLVAELSLGSSLRR
jgi:2-amino-4-hydroxy-6-hydroxymethyldihydropteridine diphosphokinase